MGKDFLYYETIRKTRECLECHASADPDYRTVRHYPECSIFIEEENKDETLFAKYLRQMDVKENPFTILIHWDSDDSIVLFSEDKAGEVISFGEMKDVLSVLSSGK